ncbi:MAG: sulfatase-like hydrolase/transferase [Bacteroidota bacterium]
MQSFNNYFKQILRLYLFWMVVFTLHRLLFSFHIYDKFATIGFVEWSKSFLAALRLDLATASFFNLPLLVLLAIYTIKPGRLTKGLFYTVLVIEFTFCSLVSAGEITTYPEWNHKLSSRIFTHLINPDEVARTAEIGMTIAFIAYFVLQLLIGFFLMKRIVKLSFPESYATVERTFSAILTLVIAAPLSIIVARGGLQQIPINMDSAYYSRHYFANDLAVNSNYFFARNMLLYMSSSANAQFPVVKEKEALEQLSDFFTYDVEHSNYFIEGAKPNIVIVLLESWTGNAVGTISGQEGATPHFDELANEGVLFTNIYATGGTSEVGNACIFSGYPALPEIYISKQPDKNRKIPAINQVLQEQGYSSHYIFSGDLKYGNIGSYFTEHNFTTVEDEDDFPSNLPHGKLNYYDKDLFNLFLKKINTTKQPFLQCAFTGSTHSPYDFPAKNSKKWKDPNDHFMNSMYYSDKCLFDFLQNCKKESWYKNTVFIFVADHGHASPYEANPGSKNYFKIPLLFYGEPIKKEYRGKRISKLGSQADISRTLLYQLKMDFKRFHWSKDLMNPAAPEFALHNINRGYGWITPKGNFTYHLDSKTYPEKNYDSTNFKIESRRCYSFMSLIYDEFKNL